jgi:hypothetical protein
MRIAMGLAAGMTFVCTQLGFAEAPGSAERRSGKTDVEHCQPIILDSLRHYNLRPESDSFKRALFERYCPVPKATTYNPSVLDDALPIITGLMVGKVIKPDREGLAAYCKEAPKVAGPGSANAKGYERILDQILASLENCVHLAQQGVIVRQQHAGPSKVNFFVRTTMTRDRASFRGVDTTPNIECYGPNPKADEEGALSSAQASTTRAREVKYDRGTIVDITSVRKALNLACTRQPTSLRDGKENYDEGLITLLILPAGNFTAYIPSKEEPVETEAARLNKEILRLQADKRQLAMQVQELRLRLTEVSTTVTEIKPKPGLLEQNLSSLRGELKGELASLKGELSGLKGELERKLEQGVRSSPVFAG